MEAARLATDAQKQLAKDKSQADLDAQNKAMKARLSNTGGADSKGLSAEMEAARTQKGYRRGECTHEGERTVENKRGEQGAAAIP